MIITSPEHRTFYLNPSETLSVVADSVSAGTIWRLGDSAGSAPQSPVSVAASETKTVGPFTTITRFDVVPSAGFLTVTQGLSAVGSNIQAYDVDLQEVADLAASNDDIIQRKVGVWTNRTVAQLKIDLSLSGTNTGDQTKSSLGLGNVDNTSDTNKPVSTAQATADTAIGTAAAADATSKANARMATSGSNGALPTSNPNVAGALWSNVGVVQVSAG